MIYEINFLVLQSRTEKLDKIRAEIEKLISQGSEKITDKMLYQKRKLAYEISHERYGFYTVYRFELKSQAGKKLDEIKKSLNLNQDIARYLIVKADELPELAIKKEEVAEEKTQIAAAPKEEAKETVTEEKTEPKKEEKVVAAEPQKKSIKEEVAEVLKDEDEEEEEVAEVKAESEEKVAEKKEEAPKKKEAKKTVEDKKSTEKEESKETAPKKKATDKTKDKKEKKKPANLEDLDKKLDEILDI